MERTLMRLIEGGIDSLRGVPGAMLAAIVGEEPYELTGTVTGLDGDTLTDESQAWAFNVYGRQITNGTPRPSCALIFQDGAAAGEVFEIVAVDGQQLQAGEDLAAAGVAVGDRYQIVRPEDMAAQEWVEKRALRVTIEYPVEAEQVPCYVVRPGPSNKLPVDAIGRVHAEESAADGVRRIERHPWHRQYQIEVVSVSEDELLWMSAIVERVLEEASFFFERIFEPGFDIQGSQIMRTEDVQPTGAFNRTYTISGNKLRFLTRRPPWTTGPQPQAAPHPIHVRL